MSNAPWLLGLFACTGLALAGCAPTVPEAPASAGQAATSSSQPAASAEPLKKDLAIGTIYSVTTSQIFVARGKDWLARDLPGAKVDLRGYADGTQIMAAFRNGELDIAYVGAVPALASSVQKPNFKVVGGTNLGGTVLVARSDRGITSVADLKGKTVSVPGMGNFQDVVLRGSILPSANLEASADPNPAKVYVVTSNPADMLARLKEGSIDAAIAFEPWPSRILLDKTLNARVVVDWNQVWRDGQYPSSVLIASTQLLRDYRSTLKRFLRAHVDATLLGQNNPKEAQRLIYEQVLALQGAELPEDVIASGFPRSQPTYDPSAEAVIESAHLIRRTYPDRMPSIPSLDELFDLGPLNEVLQEKGLPPIAP